MSNIPTIAIDGTAASGKGTLARRLADYLGYAYLDTGLLYRAVAWSLIAQNIPTDDTGAAIAAAEALDPSALDKPELRSGAAGRGASVVAAIPAVRQALDSFQKNFPARSGKAGAILDGRDIGTAIFPDAKVKFYVDADLSVRAERRYRELVAAGEAIDYETVLNDFRIRDARDKGRDFRPLEIAPDAIMIDTTAMNAEQVLQKAIESLKL
ncbi:MAG: cytidylate kinase [Micavibrio sp.]|nr:cytidylate kinase [Micavibrio sp.]